MTPRANWKGFLKIAELTCPVALYTAVSTTERISFHTLNRRTGHRVRRQFVDRETGGPVDAQDQVKGYPVGKGEYVMLDAEEVASALPESDKTLAIDSFVDCGDIDELYFDRPYYLAPSDEIAAKPFAVIREGMREKKVAALARTVLFRRVRTVLIRASGVGMIATTLNFDYEIRSAEEAFGSIPETKIKGEMLNLAKHIIATKRGKFDPTKFEDRYEAALTELVREKAGGKRIQIRKAPAPTNVVDLMEALRKSAADRGSESVRRGRMGTKEKPSGRKRKAASARKASSATSSRRKAG